MLDVFPSSKLALELMVEANLIQDDVDEARKVKEEKEETQNMLSFRDLQLVLCGFRILEPWLKSEGVNT